VKKGVLEHVIFNKYTIDENGVIRNEKREPIAYIKSGQYTRCIVYDVSGKSRAIYIGRALASTFIGPPPTTEHTADHIDKNRKNDTLVNIRWLCKSGQSTNQIRPTELKSAFIIVKDGLEKTAKEWIEHLRDQKNHMGRDYTEGMIREYVRKNIYGFSYIVYPNLQGEVWKEICGSKNTRGRWEISNMKRVKYITNFAENVLSGECFCSLNGYPTVSINGKHLYCHILSFMTFFPEEYATKKSDEFVLHEDDDKTDFRPHKLRLGTQSENITDAYNNGCYDDTRSARVKCASYIDGMFEKEHASQTDASRYLKSVGFDKVNISAISMAIKKKCPIAYGRTWERVDYISK